MQNIFKLPPHEARKIAAGEVVERPANVVKELLENALDAGATNITLHIEDGGKKLIHSIDNGCGMSAEDAHMCIEHHATSKIKCVEDLSSIATFGFRGEALSSIASVSRMTIITKNADAQLATKLVIEQGDIVEDSHTASPQGTDIKIENLFENVPARQKFLKKTPTEWRHINQLVQAFALAYTHVQFKLTHDGKQVLLCPATDSVENRCAQVWDQQLAKTIVSVDAQHPKTTLRVHGTVTNHHTFRFDRSHIFFFVNKRWVKNFTLSRALMKGYQNVLPAGRYPAACIFIEVDQADVDVNIHPRKEEVQFMHPRRVEMLISDTVKRALEGHLSQQLDRKVELKSEDTFVPRARTFNAPPASFKPFNFDALNTQPFKTQPAPTPAPMPLPQQQPVVQEKTITTPRENYTIIGQFAKTYILIEREDGLFVVDQHAAHERVLYELFSKRFADVATVKLLFPAIITLTSDEITLVQPHLKLLQQNGIQIDTFSDNQLVVNATPVHLKNQPLDDLIKEMIGWIIEHKGVDEIQLGKAINEKLHAQMACKAAVKAGDLLTREQMEKLLDDLYATNNRFSCPHGRPTGWLLDTYSIEKKFKRKA